MNRFLTKELKETKHAAERSSEKNRSTLEKLKAKLETLETSIEEKSKERISELEKENKFLRSELNRTNAGMCFNLRR